MPACRLGCPGSAQNWARKLQRCRRTHATAAAQPERREVLNAASFLSVSAAHNPTISFATEALQSCSMSPEISGSCPICCFAIKKVDPLHKCSCVCYVVATEVPSIGQLQAITVYTYLQRLAAETYPCNTGIEETCRQAAKLQVGRQDSCCGPQECCWIGLWLFKSGHPLLVRELFRHSGQCHSFAAL